MPATRQPSAASTGSTIGLIRTVLNAFLRLWCGDERGPHVQCTDPEQTAVQFHMSIQVSTDDDDEVGLNPRRVARL